MLLCNLYRWCSLAMCTIALIVTRTTSSIAVASIIYLTLDYSKKEILFFERDNMIIIQTFWKYSNYKWEGKLFASSRFFTPLQIRLNASLISLWNPLGTCLYCVFNGDIKLRSCPYQKCMYRIASPFLLEDKQQCVSIGYTLQHIFYSTSTSSFLSLCMLRSLM